MNKCWWVVVLLNILFYNLQMDRSFSLIKPEILSEISRDIGQVFFAAMVVGQIIEKNGVNWEMFSGGMILSLISWAVSLILTDKS